jgi:hypothetical protein
LNEDSSSGGRGPSSIKPPTIKPPTARDDVWGEETTPGSAPRAAFSQSAPLPVASAMPPMQRTDVASPRRQNLSFWVVLGLLFLGFLVVCVAVVVSLWLM